jgi:hypothetical protein
MKKKVARGKTFIKSEEPRFIIEMIDIKNIK